MSGICYVGKRLISVACPRAAVGARPFLSALLWLPCTRSCQLADNLLTSPPAPLPSFAGFPAFVSAVLFAAAMSKRGTCMLTPPALL